MSGTAANLPVTITLNGLPEVEAGLKKVGETARQSMGTTGTAAASASVGMNTFTQRMQSAGFQAQDLAVQLQMGTSAFVAIGQQGSQFLGAFGPAGAIAGAALAMGAMAASFLSGASASKTLAEAVKEQGAAYSDAKSAAEAYRSGLEAEIQTVQSLSSYYGSLSTARRDAEQSGFDRTRNTLLQQQRELANDVTSRLSGRTSAASGDASFDLSGMGGALSSIGGNQGVAYAADMRLATEATKAFQDAGVATVQTLSEYAAALAAAQAAGGGNTNEIGRARDAVLALIPRAQELGEAFRTNKIQQDALTSSTDALAAATGRATAKIDELKGAAARQSAAPEVALQNAQAVVKALETGGIKAAEAMQRTTSAASTLDDRVQSFLTNQANGARAVAKAEADALVLQGKREQAASRLATVEADIAAARLRSEPQVRAQMVQTDTLLEQARTGIEARREAEAAASRAATAARTADSRARRDAIRDQKQEAEEALSVYERLRVSGRSELLLGSDGDARTEQAILAKIRGTSLDPAVRERNQKKIENDLEASQKRQQQVIERRTDSIVDYSAEAFADLFEKNGTGWKGMLDTFETTAKRTFARIAAEAIIRPIVAPLVGPVMGAFSSAGVGGKAAASGGTAGVMGAVGSSISGYASGALSIGKSLMGSGMSNTGWGWLDGGLNATAYSLGGSQATAQLGSYADTGMTLNGGLGASAGSNISYGQAIGGVAGVAGGLYGIYSGMQTGGAKGVAQGLGGAASLVAGGSSLAGGSAAIGAALGPALGAVAAAAPYAAIAAVVASYFLGGQKPSDKTGVYRGNLLSGTSGIGGLEGDRFSQDNRDLASSLGKSVSDLSASLRGALGVGQTPFNFEIAAGARDGLVGSFGGKERNYKNDEAGAKQMIADMTAAMIDSMRGLASDEVRSVLNNSSGVEATLANLDFYNGTYKQLQKPFAETTSGLEMFTQQLAALVAPFTEATVKAKELGLATETLAKRAAEATDVARAGVAKGYDQSMWQSEGRGYIQGLRDVRENYETNAGLYRSVGRNPEDLYNAQAKSVLGQLSVDQLTDISQSFVGWDDAIAVLAREMLANTEATVASTAVAEAQNREQAQQNVAGTLGGITEFIRQLQLGDSSILSPEAKLGLARSQFEGVAGRAGAGDFGAVGQFTGAAGNLLTAGRDYYASGSGYADLQQRVLEAAESISNVSPETLTLSGMDSIMKTSSQSIVEAIQELRTENRLLRLEIAGMARA